MKKRVFRERNAEVKEPVKVEEVKIEEKPKKPTTKKKVGK